MTTKPKSAARLAAEASDKLDALDDRERVEMDRLAERYRVDVAELHDKFCERRDAILEDLPEEAAAKLGALRAEVADLIEPADEPTGEFDALGASARDVTP